MKSENSDGVDAIGERTSRRSIPDVATVPLRTILTTTILGVTLLWMSQPPLALAVLAWVALIPWLALILDPRPITRSGYCSIWLASAAYWALTMQGVRLAHPALYPGWIILGAYLGVYIPLFIGTSRVLVQKGGWPIWLCVPIAWSGWELIRSYAFTGFSAVLLGHTQVDFPLVTQIADLGGTYVVSFLIVLVNVGLLEILRSTPLSRLLGVFAHTRLLGPPMHPCPKYSRLISIAVTLSFVTVTLTYGAWRLRQANLLMQSSPLLTAALIQRDEPLVFTMDPEQESQAFSRYIDSAITAAKEVPDADVFVWPESMFTGGLPYRILAPQWKLPPETGMEPGEFEEAIAEQRNYFRRRNQAIQELLSQSTTGRKKPQLLAGCSVYRYGDRPEAFGGALHIDDNGDVVDWYGKRHLVMFGEYIPFGDTFPWLYNIGPLRQGATPGDGPVTMQIAGASVAPSICFETMVEQVTGNSLRELRLRGKSPDLIINLTNDAWFQGSAILSHHQRCAQMVAVMNRRPLLVAANQGPTVWIDGSGRCLDRLPTRTNHTLIARPTRDSRWSLYQSVGDLGCWPMALISIAAWVTGARARLRSRLITRPNKTSE